MSEILCNYAAAILMVLGEYPFTPEEIGPQVPFLKMAAVNMQVYDPREVNWLFRESGVYESNLEMIRDRRRKMTHVPLVEEAERWNLKLEEVAALVDINTEHQEALESVIIEPHWCQNAIYNLELARAENRECGRRLTLLHQAMVPGEWLTTRRWALDELRTKMGVEAFYRYETIPCVPYWSIPRQ